MKKILSYVLLCIIMFSCVSCDASSTEIAESSTNSYTTYYATLNCPEDTSIDGKVVEVFWKKGYYFPTPKKEAYSFNGWSYNDDILRSVDIWPYAKSAELTATWKPTTYSINYHLSPFFNDAYSEYTVESDEFKLPIPSAVEGEMFLGWTGTGLDEVTKVVKIPKGTYGEREYTAHWINKSEIEHQLDGFAFEIVDDYAVVVGYFGEWKSDLYIPSEYNGRPVKKLAKGALYEMDWYISNTEYMILNIPFSVTSIDDYALGGWDGAPMKIYGGSFEEWKENVICGVGNGTLSEW